jgi:type I restriction enzyme S subunit
MPDMFPELRLAEISVALRDGTHGTHPRVSDGVPLLSAKNISSSAKVVWDDSDSRISLKEYEGIRRIFPLERGDLLLTIVGSLGRCALYDGARVVFQRSVAFIRADLKRVLPIFLFYAVSADGFQRQLHQRSNATAQAGLYLGELASIGVPIPSLSEQQRIAEILDAVDESIRKTEEVIAKLQQMKQGLLHDLLTRGIDDNGELRDPERHPEQFKDSELGRIPRSWETRGCP